MDSYFELKALPNPEIIQSEVVAELMQALHKILPSCDGRIGLDFLAYGQQRTLGGIIRILGKMQDVKAIYRTLDNHPLIRDYALLTPVESIPATVSKYACYQRRHARGNSRFRRLKKRHLNNGSWTEELEQTLLQKLSTPLYLPHVKLKSDSTNQQFLLFVERKTSSTAKTGSFNGYGLGLVGTTVPVF
ncbi:MAG: type I-F CRISPR-associated endoribonuclease Cas6/Csy4 [Endozoicomonas sp.]